MNQMTQEVKLAAEIFLQMVQGGQIVQNNPKDLSKNNQLFKSIR